MNTGPSATPSILDRAQRVCPAACAGVLDHGLRRLVQNPRRILAPYLRPGMTALDLGCGPGFFTLAMADLVGPSGRVIAVDLQEGMLDRLRTKLRGASVEARIALHRCQQDEIGLTEKVDFALAFYMVHEVPDQEGLFRQVAALLNPGGQLLVVEPPFHVSKPGFARTLETARQAGLACVARPGFRFSRAALLAAG
jgi:ubiquinone/menaquinone biosynthesis C-methylase UbiE